MSYLQSYLTRISFHKEREACMTDVTVLNTKNPADISASGIFVEPPTRLELATYALRMRRSTN